jgi:tRNA(fMet)-specific endonuclease VapC
MYCLDTNIVVDLFRGDNLLNEKITDLGEESVDIFITPISLCELYKGAYLYHNPSKPLSDITSFISAYHLLDFDISSCEEFGKIYASLAKNGKMIPEADLIIASIVKVNDLILVTRDKKHFQDTGVKVEEW